MKNSEPTFAVLVLKSVHRLGTNKRVLCAVLGFLPFYLGAWRRANKRVVGKIGIWMSNLDQKRFLTPKSNGSKDLCGTTEWEMHNDCALFGCSKTHSEQQF